MEIVHVTASVSFAAHCLLFSSLIFDLLRDVNCHSVHPALHSHLTPQTRSEPMTEQQQKSLAKWTKKKECQFLQYSLTTICLVSMLLFSILETIKDTT